MLWHGIWGEGGWNNRMGGQQGETGSTGPWVLCSPARRPIPRGLATPNEDVTEGGDGCKQNNGFHACDQ